MIPILGALGDDSIFVAVVTSAAENQRRLVGIFSAVDGGDGLVLDATLDEKVVCKEPGNGPIFRGISSLWRASSGNTLRKL